VTISQFVKKRDEQASNRYVQLSLQPLFTACEYNSFFTFKSTHNSSITRHNLKKQQHQWLALFPHKEPLRQNCIARFSEMLRQQNRDISPEKYGT